MTPAQRNLAETALDWLYSVAPSKVDFPSIQGVIEARLQGLRGIGPNQDHLDHRLRAIERAIPMRRALHKLSRHEQRVLELVYTPRAYHGEDAVAYLNEYGPRLAPLVQCYGRGWQGGTSDLRLRAELNLSRAIGGFVLHGGISGRGTVLAGIVSGSGGRGMLGHGLR